MIKVLVKNKPADFYMNAEDELACDNFKSKCVFTIDEDATAISVMRMFMKAMIVDGYMEASIIKAMKELADYEDQEWGYTQKYQSEHWEEEV